jgi:hypothetical protein
MLSYSEKEEEATTCMPPEDAQQAAVLVER